MITNLNITLQNYLTKYIEDKDNTTVLLELQNMTSSLPSSLMAINCSNKYCNMFCKTYFANCGECLRNVKDKHFCACHYCSGGCARCDSLVSQKKIL